MRETIYRILLRLFWLVVAIAWPLPSHAQQSKPADARGPLVGVAKVDITPDYPVRLSGFGFRRTESEGVTQRIWAKALAFGPDAAAKENGADASKAGPAVLITVDNLGIPDSMVQELAARLKKAGVAGRRLAVTATHTHTAPMVTGVAPTLYSMPIPPDHQQRIDRYTRELSDKLERVALAALADRQPARLEWGIGKAGFAKNRRTKDGPVDHDMPLLAVRDPAGKLRAIYVSYACHCVTLSNNLISGDWAGFAQEHVEREHPGVVALISVGCGADSNPVSGVTGDKVEVASAQGAEIAAEVKRLLSGKLTTLTGRDAEIVAKQDRIELLLEPRTQEDWESRAKQPGAIGYHAQVNLARLARGEELKTKISYPIQTWSFGRELAMVFLPGEVVVDYSLRLKRELDGSRLWINAYANDAPCYIPSERVLKEGGYEGGNAMVYYDLPNRFLPGLEQKIVDVVRRQLDADFKPPVDPARTQGVRPLSPQQSLAAMRVREGLTVDLAVAEPLVSDPVAIDFGPDGRLWVCEMHDYPSGLDGNFQPGGRIRMIEDADGDGRYDASTIFLEGIPFPTGVTVWRRGVLVCAAPDILYCEDTTGDGRADVVRKLFSGFATHNYQARVNSLSYGLDNWVYGSCGLFGGEITSFRGGPPVALVGRDFRCRPDTGEIEPVIGRTQQGRVRNDWGDWFGCDNSTLLRHYVLEDRYVRRNPFVAPPAAAANITDPANPDRLYPVSKPVLFLLSRSAERATAACGLGIYRDDLLGAEYQGDAFVCEPVGNLVHHLRLSRSGVTFSGRRPAGEEHAEFLASTDPWFRPVQAVSGPDGALWIVDMYRYVIEHPRWIPPDVLATLDVRAGQGMGRIYRVYPQDKPPRAVPRLDRMSTTELVAALDMPNGWQRDKVQQMLVWRGDQSAVGPLRKLVASPRTEAVLHALCTLDGLGSLGDEVIAGMQSAHPGLCRQSIRLAEPLAGKLPGIAKALEVLADGPDALTHLQLAWSLGQWRDERSAALLAKLADGHATDPYLLSAVKSSIDHENIDAVLAKLPPDKARPLLSLAAAIGSDQALTRVLDDVTASPPPSNRAAQFETLAGVFDALDRRRRPLEEAIAGDARGRVEALLDSARRSCLNAALPDAERVAAAKLMGRLSGTVNTDEDVALLGNLLTPQTPATVQAAAIQRLNRLKTEKVYDVLLARWPSFTPALRNQALDVLLARAVGAGALLSAIKRGDVEASQIDATRRETLLQHREASLRRQAEQVFAGRTSSDRQQVVESFRDAAALPGDRPRGKAVFAKHCASCHKQEEIGQQVGPDLAGLPNRSPEALLVSILDPSRNVDQRYLQYLAVTTDGRTLMGLLAGETGASVTLRGQEAKDQVLLRGDIDELRSTGKSLMPEGLERNVSKQDLADLIAYLAGDGQQPASFTGHESPQALARQILDPKTTPEIRKNLLQSRPDIPAELIAALVADLPQDQEEEYRRIPWIWQVAIAAGRRNDAAQLRRVLEVSLPEMGQPLRDWQAVVAGGGIVNGLSQGKLWPAQRIGEVIRGNEALTVRWQRALTLASPMADDEKTKSGTRYDALRMLGTDSWDRCGEQLAKYLAKGTHDELQMGAISGLSDVDAPQVPAALLAGLPHYGPRNRELALDVLLRDEARIFAVLSAVAEGRIRPAELGQTRCAKLRQHANAQLRARAAELLEE